MRIKILDIIKDGNKTLGVDAIDLDTKKEIRIGINYLINNKHNIECLNGVIVSSGHIRSKAEKLKIVQIREKMILYHGSKSGIIGDISHYISREECDFGVGFYTGINSTQAKQLILNEADGKFYTLKVNLEGLNVYKFKDDILWALYVAYNRKKVTNIGDKLQNLFNKIDKSDVIIGLIADDRMNVVFPMFFDNTLTDKALIECLKYVKHGQQVVFKTEKACKALKIKSEQSIKSFDLAELQADKKEKLKYMTNDLDAIRLKYIRDGRYFYEILEEFTKR